MNRTIIITGANDGIGLAMTKALLDMSDRVATLTSPPTTSIRPPQACSRFHAT